MKNINRVLHEPSEVIGPSMFRAALERWPWVTSNPLFYNDWMRKVVPFGLLRAVNVQLRRNYKK